MDIKVLLEQLTLEEKASLVAGTNFMYTHSVPRLHIPSIRMSDGPHGLRVQTEGGDNGVTESAPATCFPTAAALAASWNPDNLYKMGQALGEEAIHYGIDIVLGPGTNIKRNPLGGRNFEYFSEDPFLAGKMATAEVQGIQSKGVGVSLKHFALNNSENYRFMGDSICDMRAMREIYLKPFEMTVKEAHPETLMCAYNKINGIYCSQNKWLLTDVLREEWKFNGLVMTDWGATHDRVEMLHAGLDLEMPGDTAICRKWIIDGIHSNKLSMEDLDQAVTHVLQLVQKHENKKQAEADFEAHHILAKEIALDSAVLLKNDGTLPFNPKEEIFVVGDLFEKMRYQGAGSSMIHPNMLTTPKNAFDENQVSYHFSRGYKVNEVNSNQDLIEQAVEEAKKYEKILVFAGLTDETESEGFDRENMYLSPNQVALIQELTKLNKKIVVVLFGGSPVELPFADQVSSILTMYLGGQNCGEACYELLFGKKSPSGKVAETWVESYTDVPFGDVFGKSVQEVYKESIYVGYHYYLTSKQKVRYPFGYGLSYTSFDYQNVQIKEINHEIYISCDVKNIGSYDGAEVVEVYVKTPRQSVFRPVRELKGFSKVYLNKGESKRVEIIIKKEDLQYWNIKENRWVLERGAYDFEICSDCETIKLATSLFLEGEEIKSPYSESVEAIYHNAELSRVSDSVFEEMSGMKISDLPSKKPITLESRFTDMQQTWMGKNLFKMVLSIANKQLKKAKKLPEGTERDNKIKGAIFLKRILESNSLISMSMCGGKDFPYNYAVGMMHLANGRIFKGIRCFCKKIKISKK